MEYPKDRIVNQRNFGDRQYSVNLLEITQITFGLVDTVDNAFACTIVDGIANAGSIEPSPYFIKQFLGQG